MEDAVRSGDAKKVAELMKQDPGFDVNMVQGGNGWTLLHCACCDDSRFAVIPLLLADPDINVNVKDDIGGATPFYYACNGRPSCVREMLKDPRVKVNERNHFGSTPLFRAAANGPLDVIRWWIASGREMDLGTPGDIKKTDAIGRAKKSGKTEVVTLLERFKSDAARTRHATRVELGCLGELAAEMFSLVVFVSDGLLQVNDTPLSPAARFFYITTQLPLELQMVLCFRVVGSAKEIITGKESELAFGTLARSL